jgi:hypothetical protein
MHARKGLVVPLRKNRHVIFYESKKLKEHEINYATHDLDLETIVHALKMWRHYLMDIKFKLMIDHSDLKYLFEQPTLNSRQMILMKFLN